MEPSQVARVGIRQSLTLDNFRNSILNFSILIATNVTLRAVFGFTFVFGLLLLILSYQHEIPVVISLPVSSMVAGVVTIFFILSQTVRCVMILSIPNFCTQQGRFVLFAFVTSILVGGPLISFSSNLVQFGESVKCISSSTLRQGEEIMKNYAQSYDEVNEYMNFHLKSLEKAKEYVDQNLLPLKEEARKIQEKMQNLEQVLHKHGRDCHLTIEGLRVNCVIRAIQSFSKCKSKLKLFNIIDDICELVWISSDVCEGTLDHRAVCFPVQAAEFLTREIKAGIENIKEALDFQFRVDKNHNNSFNHSINATEIEGKIKASFQKMISNMEAVLTVVKYFFFSAIAWIPLKSWLFLRKVRQCHSSKFAFVEHLPEYNEQQRSKELFSQGFLLFLHLMFSLTIFGIDYAVYWVQQSVLELGGKGNLTFENSFEFNLNVTIGEALLFNPIIDLQNEYLNNLSLDKSKNYTFTTSTEECLPKPIESSGFISLLLVLLVYVLILIILIYGNQLLKYRLSIIYFIMPELIPDENTTLIPYSTPSVVQPLSTDVIDDSQIPVVHSISNDNGGIGFDTRQNVSLVSVAVAVEIA